MRIEQLESRRLLAADLSVIDMLPTETAQPEIVMCGVAEVDAASDVQDFETTELFVDPVDSIDSATSDLQPEAEAEVEQESDVQQESEVETASDALVHDLGDPVDGTDGFFGSINAESSNQTFEITPSAGGMVEIVVASSLNDAEAEAALQVTDANGDSIDCDMTEDVAGFHQVTFEVEAGETYHLNVSVEEGVEGHIQVTASYDADLHADIVGEDSTELELVNGEATLTGDLEEAGDVDTFRFTADAAGKATLGLTELNPDNSTELQVQVFDSTGNPLTRGITNETVGISFDVESGNEYFLAISAGEGQTGSYQIDMTLEADAVEPEVGTEVDSNVEPEVEAEVDVEPEVELETEVESDPEPEDEPEVEPELEVEPEMELEPEVEPELEPEVEPVVDLHADEIGQDATELTFVDDVASFAEELETADNTDAFQFVAPGNGEVELDLSTTSADNAADASVAVFESSSNDNTETITNAEPVVSGTTNDDVGILFDVVQGDSYQVLVDALNDIPASYELSLKFSEADLEVADDTTDESETLDDLSEIAPVDDTPELTDVVNVVDDLADDVMDVCLAEVGGETEVLDSIFADFEPDSII